MQTAPQTCVHCMNEYTQDKGHTDRERE
jgi:hypothetical protein